MTADDFRRLTAALLERDARDSLDNAEGWTVLVHHEETPHILVLYGFYSDWQSAMLAAVGKERSMNAEDDEEEGCWTARVEPIMPGSRA